MHLTGMSNQGEKFQPCLLQWTEHALTWDTLHHINIHNQKTPIISPDNVIQSNAISKDDYYKRHMNIKACLLKIFWM